MKNKLLKLVERNGFLLSLFICVCLVAGGTIYIATRDVQDSSKKLDNKDLVILEQTDKIDSKGDDVDKVKDNSEVPEVDKITEVPEVDQASEVVQSLDAEEDHLVGLEEGKQVIESYKEETSSDKLEFVEEAISYKLAYNIPTEDAILTAYTDDSLIYSNTLDEWRGHSGVDIKAEIGSNISSPLDGVVKESYEDSLWGMIIVIDHGNGLESKFCNLGTLEMVSVGTNVKKGEIISKVGNSADIEMIMDSHIHLETRKNGKLIDPRSIND